MGRYTDTAKTIAGAASGALSVETPEADTPEGAGYTIMVLGAPAPATASPPPEPADPVADLVRLNRQRYEADKKIYRGYDVEATIPLNDIPPEIRDWPLERLTEVAKRMADGSKIVMFDRLANQFVVVTGTPDGVLWKIWRELCS